MTVVEIVVRVIAFGVGLAFVVVAGLWIHRTVTRDRSAFGEAPPLVRAWAIGYLAYLLLTGALFMVPALVPAAGKLFVLAAVAVLVLGRLAMRVTAGRFVEEVGEVDRAS